MSCSLLQALDVDDGSLSGEARVAVMAKLVLAWSWLDPSKAEELAQGLPSGVDDDASENNNLDAEELERTAEVRVGIRYWLSCRSRCCNHLMALRTPKKEPFIIIIIIIIFFFFFFFFFTSLSHQVPRSNRLRRLLLDRNAPRAEATTTSSSNAGAENTAAATASSSSTTKFATSKHPQRQAAYVAALVAQVRNLIGILVPHWV